MSPPLPRVLVLGAYGVFGRRACDLLARRGGLALVVAGRSRAKADALRADLAAAWPDATVEAAAVDAGAADLAATLGALAIRVVVHAAGPFQGQDYHVAEACIAAGAHYVDLADGAAFVAGIEALNGAARDAGVTLISGASTVPALTSAILAGMQDRHGRPLRAVTAWLSPGNRTPRGLAVVRAILSYAGRPIVQVSGGRTVHRPGWGDLHRFTIGARLAAGHRPLSRRWFSTVEMPDAVLLALLFPTLRDARFFAGLELGLLHLGLWGLSWLVRGRLLRSLAPLARPLHWIAERLIGFGGDRGGMEVAAVLGDPPDAVAARWTVIAEDGSGPTIPAVPAAIMAGRLLGGLEETGARPCLAAVSLDDFAAAIAHLPITVIERAEPIRPLFERLIDARQPGGFAALPPAVRAMHLTARRMTAHGRYRSERRPGLVRGLAARLTGFPPGTADGALRVTFAARPDGSETWTRDFAGHVMRSVLRPGRAAGLVEERFGMLTGVMRLEVDAARLAMVPVRLRLGRLALPRWLTPHVAADEREVDGRFVFSVAIAMPLIGDLVRYEGWLEAPVAEDDAASAPILQR